jgi:hypothetical protein
MSLRFATNIAVMIAGGVVVVFSQAVGPGVTSWIAFGVALGILATLALAQVDGSRGLAQRALDALCGALAVWTVVASAVFTGGTVMWLSFGEGLGFAALALAGLIAHELSTERVVHALAIQERPKTYAEAS